MSATVDMDGLFRRLHLANARRIWKDLCARAEKDDWTYQQLLETLVTEEIMHRRGTRTGRLVRRAGFPFLKTIDDFDFTFQTTLRLSMLGSHLSPDFVTDGRNLVLIGRPGRGKTHLAVAIAYRAIQNGFESRFTTAAALIDALSKASQQGDLRTELQTWVHPHVLVIDEMGYLAYGSDAANLLFHVVNERSLKKRSMVFTTNKALRSWGQVLHDVDLGDTIVDRVLERGTVLKLDGPSVRTRHVDPADLEGPDRVASEPARISGMDRPDFPEPTGGEQQAGHAHADARRAAVSDGTATKDCGTAIEAGIGAQGSRRTSAGARFGTRGQTERGADQQRQQARVRAASAANIEEEG